MKTRTPALGALALVVATASDAAAQAAAEAKPAESSKAPAVGAAPAVSLVTDVRSLSMGVAAVTTELDLGRHTILPFLAPRDTSFAFTLGAGRLRTREGHTLSLWDAPCRSDATTCRHESTLQVGMQALTYLVGDFRSGWQVGLEAKLTSYFGGTETQNHPYTHARPTTDGVASRGVFAPGIVSGYKAVLWGGLTLGPQAAVDMWIATNGAPVQAGARLAIDAGWSF